MKLPVRIRFPKRTGKTAGRGTTGQKESRRPRKRRGRSNGENGKQLLIMGAALLVIVIAFASLFVHRYAPTKETMKLSDYFQLKTADSCAVIRDGTYDEEGDAPNAILSNGAVYMNLTYMKNRLDDGYVFDSTENTLRYATDKNLITAYLNREDYLVDRESGNWNRPVVIASDGNFYLDLQWAAQYTDLQYQTEKNPARVVIETAGWKHQTTKLTSDGALRRFGGVKSRILKNGKKGDPVIRLETYGKWSKVLSADGVIGCVENRRLGKVKTVKTKANLPERNYTHKEFGKKICLGWHQVTSAAGNASLTETLSKTKGINVISPTWYALADNQGNITDFSDASYVNQCHNSQIQVWALFSNLGENDVDTGAVLNTTSSRDNLVNSLLASAITSNVDGINVDLEALSDSARDGYIEFIRELSLKCRKNDLYLSVDNYPPTDSSAFYQRKIQADYADYIILMGYDEHYAGSETAGSVASIGFVKQGIQDTLKEVPAKQLVLGMPFYTRVWVTDQNGQVTSSAMGMDAASSYLTQNQAAVTWSEKDGQNYGAFSKDGKTYQCWLEDAKSLSLKLQAMNDNGLAGGAFWKLGLESDSIWDTIGQYIGS